MPLRYHLAYDIADERLPHPAYLIIGTMLLLAGVLMLVYRRRRDGNARVGRLLILASFVFVAATSLRPWWDVLRIKQRMRTEARIVEGRIEAHRVQAAGIGRPRTHEQFRVDTMDFHFWREDDVPGFHNSRRPPLDLHDGLPVRITYLFMPDTSDAPRIMRLEVAHDG